MVSVPVRKSHFFSVTAWPSVKPGLPYMSEEETAMDRFLIPDSLFFISDSLFLAAVFQTMVQSQQDTFSQ